MSDTLERMRARHEGIPVGFVNEPGEVSLYVLECAACHQPWPCDAALALDVALAAYGLRWGCHIEGDMDGWVERLDAALTALEEAG